MQVHGGVDLRLATSPPSAGHRRMSSVEALSFVASNHQAHPPPSIFQCGRRVAVGPPPPSLTLCRRCLVACKLGSIASDATSATLSSRISDSAVLEGPLLSSC